MCCVNRAVLVPLSGMRLQMYCVNRAGPVPLSGMPRGSHIDQNDEGEVRSCNGDASICSDEHPLPEGDLTSFGMILSLMLLGNLSRSCLSIQ